MPTLFSRIITGELPSYMLYEDEYTFAFLSIFPHMPGHTLIVPKIEVDHFSDVPEPYYTAIFQTAKLLSPVLQAVTGSVRTSTMFSGFEIPHAHYHLVPCITGKELDFSYAKKASPEELKDMQEKILKELADR